MRKSELLVVFYLLQDNANVRKNIRQIAADLSLSIGSVFNALKKLQDNGFLIETDGLHVLRKRSILIDRWAKAYPAFRDKNIIARFSFLNRQIRQQWADIRLSKTLSWGGEPAAALLDGYIQPQRWDIYTADNANALISTARMIPSVQGEIYVYKRFWHTEDTPVLVIYADLFATADDRCREAAERIKPLI